jgi:sugar lactone lactonase YvrE
MMASVCLPGRYFALATLAFLGVLLPALGYAQTDIIADLALGQNDLEGDAINFGGPAALNFPVEVAVDGSGHIYVVDPLNNRVLGWAAVASLTNGAPAGLVIGQPDFFSYACTTTQSGLCFVNEESPASIAVDSAGNLYVGDAGNYRILEFDSPFTSGMTAGQPAHLVFGQGGSFTSNANDCNSPSRPLPDSFCLIGGLAVDATGNLYTSKDNSVVEEYNTPLVETAVPGSGDTTADVILGSSCSSAPAASCFVEAGAIAADGGGNLYVADGCRVLEFDTPLSQAAAAGSGDIVAHLVFGQNGKFTTEVCSNGGAPNAQGNPHPSARGLGGVEGLAVDGAGNLYVADGSDEGNNRVLEYNTPLKKARVRGSGYATADLVFGQANFTANVFSDGFPSQTGRGFDPPPSARGLSMPAGIALDTVGNLYVADSQNNRVLVYYTPLRKTKVRGSGDTAADLVLGQNDLNVNPIDSGGPSALYNPQGVAIDSEGHLYVADSYNNRVLGWENGAEPANGAPADIVIGQPDFFRNLCSTTRKGLCLSPGGGVAVDGAGNLYVADTGNNRVLEYAQPFQSHFSAGQPAHLVFGQLGSFTRSVCGSAPPSSPLNAKELCAPIGLAVDSAGNLYVGEILQVLEYNTPLKKTRVPGSGDTTADLEFGGIEPPCCSPLTLHEPDGIAVDSAGNLWVADTGSDRVLEYNTPLEVTSVPGSGDTAADFVLGQNGSLTTASCIGLEENNSGPPATAAGLCHPGAVAVDSAGNVYVSDTANNRVLEYYNALTNPTAPNTADAVFGQSGSFTGDLCNAGAFSSFSTPLGLASAAELCGPNGLAVDSAGNVWITDSLNNRVVKYNAPMAASSAAAH